MIALVMAGGKNTRMNSQEKLLFEYKKPVVLHVIDSLKNSNCFSKIIVATSNNSPKTKEFLLKSDVHVFDTPGNGYANDLNLVLKSLNDRVLVVSGDLALLDNEIISKLVKKQSDIPWISILVSRDFLNSIGLESEFVTKFKEKECVYTGISLVNSKKISNFENIEEQFMILDDKKIAFNLNTPKDYERLLEINDI